MVREDAERNLGQYFHAHVKEWHPSKDAGGYALYNFRAELLRETERPMRVDLLELLDTAFATDTPGCNLSGSYSSLFLKTANTIRDTPAALQSWVPIRARGKAPRAKAKNTFIAVTISPSPWCD